MTKSGKYIVTTIGGGTGTFVVLSGLKTFSNVKLSAIISSADDGGSNKKFRDEFGLLPPSDFRQCLVALANDSEGTQVMRKLFMYRFEQGEGLQGQTFGNIFIAALTDIVGSQIKAMNIIGKILKICGKIIPITTDNIRLIAEYEDGEIVFGEHFIDEPDIQHNNNSKIKSLYLNRKAKVYPEAHDTILRSDYIIIGPGDLYTSTIANLIVGNTANLLQKTKAKIIYISNLMTKIGQTTGFTLKDHVTELVKYMGRVPDYILVNKTPIDLKVIARYGVAKETQVLNDLESQDNKSLFPSARIILADMISHTVHSKSKSDTLKRSLIRHDPKKVSKEIIKIINQHENHKSD